MSSAVFPNGGRSVVEQMCAKFPELHVNDDAKQRTLTTRIQEQFVYQWGRKWGGKKRTGLSDDFKSKDSMAYDEGGGYVSTYDMFQGNEAVTILVHDGNRPDHPDQPPSDAVFMAVEPRDWLGVPTPGPGPEQPADEINARFDRLEQQQAEDTGKVLARIALTEERLMNELHRLSEEAQESIKKFLRLYLLQQQRPDQPPPVGGEGEPPSELMKLLLKAFLENRPTRHA